MKVNSPAQTAPMFQDVAPAVADVVCMATGQCCRKARSVPMPEPKAIKAAATTVGVALAPFVVGALQ